MVDEELKLTTRLLLLVTNPAARDNFSFRLSKSPYSISSNLTDNSMVTSALIPTCPTTKTENTFHMMSKHGSLSISLISAPLQRKVGQTSFINAVQNISSVLLRLHKVF